MREKGDSAVPSADHANKAWDNNNSIEDNGKWEVRTKDTESAQ